MPWRSRRGDQGEVSSFDAPAPPFGLRRNSRTTRLNGLITASLRLSLAMCRSLAPRTPSARAFSTSRLTTNAQLPALPWIVDPWKRLTVHPAFLRIQSRLRSRLFAPPPW